MGLYISKIWSYFESSPARVLLIGLDAAGKTSLLYKCKLNEVVTTIPTIGFNVETVEPVKGLQMTVWDVGGQERIRRLWKHYVQNVDAVVWMVDSNDPERFSESKNEMFDILSLDELRSVPVLIFSNKMDLPNAVNPSILVNKLNLSELRGRKWHVQGTNCISGEGITEGFSVLAGYIKEYRANRNY